MTMIQGFQGRTDPVAVFVDGDNLSHDHATAILNEAAQHGTITLQRVYGNMAKLKDWGADPRFAAHHAASEGGKNNADIRLVIDAIEHALAGRARVFVVASNDSDFGPLAARLRELGFVVVGVGGSRPARGFEVGCSQFVKMQEDRAVQPDAVVKTTVIPKIVVARRVDPPADDLSDRVRAEIIDHGKQGAIPLSLLGSRLGAARTYGATTWRAVLEARADSFIVKGLGADTTVRLHPDVKPPR